MPLIYAEELPESAKIGVWHITEELRFFEDAGLQAREITHPHKRLQHLGGRKLLQTLAPDSSAYKIEIGPTGKPFFSDTTPHFSVSHAGDYAAVMVSEKHNCGCDIELYQQKILSIAYKFTSPAEQKILQGAGLSGLESATVAWSVKEAVFKWYEAGGIDFREDIKILSASENARQLKVVCAFAKTGGELTVSVSVHHVFVLARLIGDLR